MATNLQFIKQVTHSGSSVNSISITDIFSADYDVYQIQINDLVYDSPAYFYCRLLDSSNTAITSSSYDYANLLLDTGSSWTERKDTSSSYFMELGYFGSGTTNSETNIITVFNPFSSSTYSFCTNQGYGHFGTRGNGTKGIGVLKDTQSCKGFQVNTQTAGVYFTAGTITAFGVK